VSNKHSDPLSILHAHFRNSGLDWYICLHKRWQGLWRHVLAFPYKNLTWPYRCWKRVDGTSLHSVQCRSW
jgi:hypothetical protein